MKTHIKNLFTRLVGAAARSRSLSVLIAGLCLMPASRVTALIFSTQPVTAIAAGYGHTLFTRSDGTLFVMGDNTDGQLGLGTTITNVNVPTALTNGVGTIVAGGYHSLFIMNRALWAMGDNEHGQLGDGTFNNHYVPEQVYALGHGFSFTAVGAGLYHSLFGIANLTGGSLLATNYNGSGQLGDGSYNDHNTPEVIFSASPGSAVTSVAGGSAHSIFTKPDRNLWGMGGDTHGQLGYVVSTNKPVEISAGSYVSTVAAGSDFSFFIGTDGDLWAWGDNTDGQLGTPDNDTETSAKGRLSC